MAITGAGWKVVDAIDTREYEDVGDYMKPIPGSGDSMSCECCGRAVQVHVRIERRVNGAIERAVIGQSCAKKLAGKVTGKIETRRPCELTDTLIAAGCTVAEGRRIASNLKKHEGGDAWECVHAHMKRSQYATIEGRSGWEPIHAVIRAAGYIL